MKTIKITQGKVAMVDDEDYEELNKYNWSAIKRVHTYYVARAIKLESGKWYTGYMHRHINNTPDDMCTDHIDGNGLNNQKNNLRTCTNSENQRNGRNQKNTSSKYKGVQFNKNAGKWRTLIIINPGEQQTCLGYFEIEEDAALAYNEAAKKYHGEFARLNVIN